MDLCKYKDILGIPSRGIHKHYIFPIAIADVIMTFMFSFAISYIFKISFLWTTLFMFILGIICHRIFCVRTEIDKLLFS
jgi:hypothetical protein